MTDKEKIRAEIKRQIAELIPTKEKIGIVGGMAVKRHLESILSFIDSLQEEPKKCMYSKDNYTDEDRKVLCDGCEEECEFNKKEEPESEDLEKELSRLLKDCEIYSEYIHQDFLHIVANHFADWQKERMMKETVNGTFSFGELADSTPIDSIFVLDKEVRSKYKDGDRVKVIIIKEN